MFRPPCRCPRPSALQVLKRKQYEHTLAERRILENIDHPFIVSLRFAFQSEHKLYMVSGGHGGASRGGC